ncbi:hypothetical protein K2X85_10145 [bacterium]|nr:hypothetical protein [bacterium]
MNTLGKMIRPSAMALLILWSSGWTFAQPPANANADPDALLPLSTSLYFRWHAQSEYADLWKESMAYGVLVKSGLSDFIGALLTPDNVSALLAGFSVPEEQTAQVDAIVRGLLQHSVEHGLVMGGDLRPLTGELTIVLPQGAGTEWAGRIDSLVRDYAKSQSLEVKEQPLFGRAVATVKIQTFFLNWWNEGKHLVLSINQLGPNKPVGRAAGKGDAFPKSPRYASFKRKRDYAVIEEFAIDLEPIMKLLPAGGVEIAKTIDMLGAKGLKGLILTTGLEGKMLRTDWDVLMSPERNGLLSMLGGPALDLKKLPQLPADRDFLYATTINWTKVYDEIFAALLKMGEIYPDMGLETAPAMVEAFEETLGYQFRDEIFASLGEQIILYSSPTDGPLFTGVSMAVSVKDSAVIGGAIDRVVDLVGLMDSKFLLEKVERSGVTYWIAGYSESAMPMAPTLALGKNWLVLTAISPAAATRFFELQESGAGSNSAWANIDTKGVPGTVTGVIQHDPRRAIEFIASFLPMMAATVRNMQSDIKIDLTRAPRADVVVAHVAPSHSITSFDEEGLHCVSRYSLPLTNPELMAPTYGLIIGTLFTFGIAPPADQPLVDQLFEDEGAEGEMPAGEEPPPEQEAGPAEPADEKPAGDMTRRERSRPVRAMTYLR